jgi:hypothetical protein
MVAISTLYGDGVSDGWRGGIGSRARVWANARLRSYRTWQADKRHLTQRHGATEPRRENAASELDRVPALAYPARPELRLRQRSNELIYRESKRLT